MISRIGPSVTAALALLAALIAAPTTAGAVYPAMDLAHLARSADAVVIATPVGAGVRDARPAGARRPLPVTDTRLRVVREIAGARPGSVVVSQPGGAVDGVGLRVSDAVRFVAGRTYVVFLDGEDRVVGGPQGSLPIVGGQVAGHAMTPVELERAVRAARQGYETFESAPSASSEAGVLGPSRTSVAASSVGASSLPAVASITPPKQVAGLGRRITITGTGFGSTQGSGSVRFVYGRSVLGDHGDPAPVVGWSDTAITVEVPQYACSGHLLITTGGGAQATPFYDVGYSASGLRYPVAPSAPVTYRVNENYAPMNDEAIEISKAMATWSGAGSRFRVVRSGTTAEAGVTSNENDVNEIWFAALGHPGPLAINYLWYFEGQSDYVESDIIFNSDYQWGAGATESAFDVQSIALHELGHTVGLDDQYPNTWRVMGAAEWGVDRRALFADEVAGAIDLHGVDVPAAPVVSSVSHPVEEQWHASALASFDLTATGVVSGYSYVLDTAAATNPDAVIDTTATSLSLAVPDGERWFHVRAVNASGAGPVRHYRLRTDTAAPTGTITLGGESAYASSTALAATAALSDARSGLGSMRFDGGTGFGAWASYASTATLTLASPDGTRTVRAEYTDGAGNVLAAAREVVLDRAAPVSSATTMSADGSLTVSIEASDAVSGVGGIWVRHGDASPAVLSAPLVITQPGEHVVTWFSVDLAGNHETEKSMLVTVPGTDPDPDPDPLPEPRPTQLSILSTSRLAPAYGGSALVAVRLAHDDGTPVVATGVKLRTTAGVAVRTMSPVTGSPGTYTCTAPVVRSRTVFRVSFPGDAESAPAARDLVVRPKAYLTRRVPSAARPRASFTVYGTLRPAHSSAPVRIEVQKRRLDGTYAAHGATKTVRTSTTTVRGRFALARGTYRIRFVHEDFGHTRTVTSWATIRVR